MLKFLGLASGFLITLAIAPHPVQAQAQNLALQSQSVTQNDSESRESETCIKLRGCGRRELTWLN